jgi:hypothetical protein
MPVKKKNPKKKAAKKKKTPVKKSGLRNVKNDWRIECSEEGVIKKGLTRQQAKDGAARHQSNSGHRTTYTNSQ